MKYLLGLALKVYFVVCCRASADRASAKLSTLALESAA